MGFLRKILKPITKMAEGVSKFPGIKQVTGGLENILGIDPTSQILLGGGILGGLYGLPALMGGGAAGPTGMMGGTGGMMGTSGLGSTPGSWLGGLGETLGGLGKSAGKFATSDWGKLLGLQALGGYQKGQQMKGMAEAEQKAYQDYLNILQPSEATKATQFANLKSGLTGMHSQSQRQLENALAAKGIRGQGRASPITGGHQALQDAINQAYFQIYGQPATIPSGPAPSGYYPGGMELGGMDITDILSMLMMSKIF